MRRPYSNKSSTLWKRDLRKDMTQEQLAGVGLVALSYNYAENAINRIIEDALKLTQKMSSQVTSRINGIDGKIEIIKLAAADLKIRPDIRSTLASSLGDGEFKLFKKYRDAVIHSRVSDRELGLGEAILGKADHIEVLLTKEALNGLYERLNFLSFEFVRFMLIFRLYQLSKEIPDDGEGTTQYEGHIQSEYAQVLNYRRQRLALTPLPEFPA